MILTKPFRPDTRMLTGQQLFRGTEKSLWNFYAHGVTSSLLNAFLICREQTRLAYVLGLGSRFTPLAMEFGTCCHWVLEQVYHEMEYRSLVDGRDMRPEALVREYEQKWLAETPAPTQAQLENQEKIYGMAEIVLPEYFRRWDGDFTGKYSHGSETTRPAKWLSLEEIFNVPYQYPDGLTVPIRGRRDGVFVDGRGAVWVFDTKCRSVINDEDAMDTLPFDLQQMLYLWVTCEQAKTTGLRKEIGCETSKAFPSGVVMNIIRRPGQRWLKDDTLSSFLDRVRADVSPKKYDHYFIRYQMSIGVEEVLLWKKTSFDPIMREIRGWWEGKVPHYMNPNGLVTKYGRCQYFLPITKGDFSGCFKREKIFPELD